MAVDRARRTGHGTVTDALIDELAAAAHATIHVGLPSPTLRRRACNDVHDMTAPALSALAASIERRLTLGPGWPPLLAAPRRAGAAGYDLADNLRRLADQAPLPVRHSVRELHHRLYNDCPAALPTSRADDIAGVLNPPAATPNGDAP